MTDLYTAASLACAASLSFGGMARQGGGLGFGTGDASLFRAHLTRCLHHWSAVIVCCRSLKIRRSLVLLAQVMAVRAYRAARVERYGGVCLAGGLEVDVAACNSASCVCNVALVRCVYVRVMQGPRFWL